MMLCKPKRFESDFQKNCDLKEEVFKGAVKNMIVVKKSLLGALCYIDDHVKI